MTLSDYVKGYPSKVKKELPNSAVLNTAFLPAGAYLETAVTGMSDLVNMQSRAYGAAFATAILPA